MTRYIRSGLAALPILLLLGVPARAATYFVSPSGADSNSCATAQSNTAGKQKRTIAAGVACLTAGDTLYIRGGTYTGAANTIDSQDFTVPSGTSWSNAITIAGYSGETVTIQPPDGRSGIRLTTGGPGYLIFRDFTIDMANQTAVHGPDGVYLSSGAHHNRFLRLDVKNAMHNGFHFSNSNANSPFNEILNCKIHHNGRWPEINKGYGAYIFTSDNLIEGNDIYSNGGYGLHLYNSAGPFDVARNVVRNNRIHHNGTRGGTNYGIVVAWGTDNLIYNNLIYSNRGGIQVYLDARNTQIYNNTIYGNLYEGIVMQYYGSAPTVRNNIVYANADGIINYGGSGTPMVDHNLTSDAKFVDAAASDFRLQSDSAAEDAGIMVTKVTADYAGVARPQGAAYDIGAYERQKQGGRPSAPRKLRIVSP